MRINKIQLHNFRNFSDTSFEFPSQFTVVIGENRRGKSSLLQGIRLAAGTFLLGLDEPPRLHIQKEDVRRIDVGQRFVPQRDCFFHAWGELNNQHLEWKRTLAREGGRTDYKEAYPLIELAENLNNRVNQRLENSVDMPVFCFFSTARLWSESKQRIDLKKKGSKIKDGYGKCLDIKSDRITSLQWIKANYYKQLKGKDTEGFITGSSQSNNNLCTELERTGMGRRLG
ncbi:MAG: ATP-binding protein [Chitinophagaceae bacterium]